MSEHKKEVAIFDENRVLIAVREVDPADHVTDTTRRQMALHGPHDLHGMLGRYKASPNYKTLEPIVAELPRQEFFEVPGMTIGRWQTIEYMLGDIFDVFISPSNKMSCRKAFDKVTNFSTRLEMTNAASEDAVSNDMLQQWRYLHKRMSRCSKNRNKLAHLRHLFLSGPNTENDFVLVDAKLNKKISKKDIEDIGAEFGELGFEISKFLEGISSK